MLWADRVAILEEGGHVEVDQRHDLVLLPGQLRRGRLRHGLCAAGAMAGAGTTKAGHHQQQRVQRHVQCSVRAHRAAAARGAAGGALGHAVLSGTRKPLQADWTTDAAAPLTGVVDGATAVAVTVRRSARLLSCC